MKNKLKIALILGGIIGSTHGSTLLVNDQTDSSRSALCALTINTHMSTSPKTGEWTLRETLENKINTLASQIAMLEEKAEGYQEMIGSPFGKVLEEPLSLTENYWRIQAEVHNTIADQEYYTDQMNKLDQGNLNQEELKALESNLQKKAPQITDTTSGRDRPQRSEESLRKEAQQNCLGKITSIRFSANSGALQTIMMAPSTATMYPTTKTVKQPTTPPKTFWGAPIEDKKVKPSIRSTPPKRPRNEEL